MSRPSRHILRQLCQDERSSLAAAVEDGIGNVAALAECRGGDVVAHTQQVTDVRHNPLFGCFDEPVLVQAGDIRFDTVQLLADESEQRTQRFARSASRMR